MAKLTENVGQQILDVNWHVILNTVYARCCVCSCW